MPVKKRFFTAATAIILLFIAVVFIVKLSLSDSMTLLIKNQDSGKLYKSFSVKNGDIFSVEFIHSVNKSPVCDYFEIIDGDIYAVKTRYSAFGAGVQTEIEEGQTLSYDDEGNMIVSGFNLKFDSVRYIVGTVSDHILEIGDEKISLRELCGRNAHIEFVIKK